MTSKTIIVTLELTAEEAATPSAERISTDLEAAIQAARLPYALHPGHVLDTTPLVIVDMDQDLFNEAIANFPVDVVVRDANSPPNRKVAFPNGNVVEMWTGYESADVNPDIVAAYSKAIADPYARIYPFHGQRVPFTLAELNPSLDPDTTSRDIDEVVGLVDGRVALYENCGDPAVYVTEYTADAFERFARTVTPQECERVGINRNTARPRHNPA